GSGRADFRALSLHDALPILEAVDWRASSAAGHAGMRRAGSRVASASPPGTAPTAAARIASTGWKPLAAATAIGQASRNMRSWRGRSMQVPQSGFDRPMQGACRRPAQAPAGPADTAAMTHNLLNRIDQRTRLAGHNRLALLLFRLGGRQLF